MTNAPESVPHRWAPWVDLATRVVRLLAWIAMLAACSLMLWLLSIEVGRADDPRAAAREVGQAGTADAIALARDASKAQKVPGFAGTNVPERRLDDRRMASAANARMADADDPGGKAGRALIRGVNTRPARPVSTSDPGVVRANAAMAAPRSRAHGAGAVATGAVADCGAEAGDAGRGGDCGAVSYCVGADCETVASEGNTGFARSASMLNMVLEMGGEEFDRENLRFFAGEKRDCAIKYGGLANCCRDSGLLVGLANCSAEEKELADERHAGNTHYLGRRCAKRVLGVCVKRKREWCVFGSKLGRILHQQARPQLGIGWRHCKGFTIAQIKRIDFDRLDLSEFTENLVDGTRKPSVSLPERGETQAAMEDRVRDYYRRNP